jgi:hypothetical protein
MTDKHDRCGKKAQYLQIGHGGFQNERLSSSGAGKCGVQERNIAYNGFFENINFQESMLADDSKTRKRASLNS